MTTKAGLGEHVFANLRYDDSGELTDHELNSEVGKAWIWRRVKCACRAMAGRIVLVWMPFRATA